MKMLLTAAFVLAIAAPAQAQFKTQPKAGDRVRVDLRQGYSVDGTVVKYTPESIIVARGVQPQDTVSIPLTSSVRIRISIGRERSTMTGVGIGLAVGGGLGALFGGATYTECEGLCIMAPESAGQAAAIVGIGGALVGAVLGGAVGYGTVRETWQDASLPAVGFAPMRDGRVAMSLRFAF